MAQPSRQYELICKIAGPDKPRWVKRTASLKLVPPALARAGAAVPEIAANGVSEKVKGTSAGRVSVTVWPNCVAIS